MNHAELQTPRYDTFREMIYAYKKQVPVMLYVNPQEHRAQWIWLPYVVAACPSIVDLHVFQNRQTAIRKSHLPLLK